MVDRTGRQMKNLKPAASALKLRPGQTAEQASDGLIKRVIEHASRHERMLATRQICNLCAAWLHRVCQPRTLVNVSLLCEGAKPP